MAGALSSFYSCPAACTAGAGRLKAAENPIFRAQKSFHCSFCARKSERFFAKTGRGGSGEGASSPVHQLVKSLFDKPMASLNSGGAVFEGIAIPAILRYNSIIRPRLEIISKGENVV